MSISLSWLIWTNPARYGGSRHIANEKVQSNQVKRDMSDVILPTQIIYTNHDKQQLINNSKKIYQNDRPKLANGVWKVPREYHVAIRNGLWITPPWIVA